MTLPLTWDQMPLTAAQQTAIQQLIAWSNSTTPNSPPDPPVTYSQIKDFRRWLASLSALVEPGRTAMSRATQFYQNQQIATYEAANP